MRLRITVNNVAYDVEVDVLEDQEGVLSQQTGAGGAAPAVVPVPAASPQKVKTVVASLASGLGPVPAAPGPPPPGGGVPLCSQIPGTVVEILVQPGQSVKAGEAVIVLDAMKMNMQVNAQMDGTVRDILVRPGEAVKMGQPLITFN